MFYLITEYTQNKVNCGHFEPNRVLPFCPYRNDNIFLTTSSLSFCCFSLQIAIKKHS